MFLNKKGFTLVELLITMAVLILVAGTFISFILSISSVRAKINAQHEVQSNMRDALNVIGRNIRQSSGINVTSSVFDADPGAISLVMSSSTINPTIINLSLDNGTLQITQGASQVLNLTNSLVKVTDLRFNDLSGNGSGKSIRVYMTVEYANPSSPEYSFSLSTTSTFSRRK